MDNTRRAVARKASSATAQREGEGIPRREALKSLVAGFAAAPTLTNGVALAQERESASNEGSLVDGTRDQLFDGGWRFHRGDAPGAERPEFDDTAWQRLDLPHDWSIEPLPPLPQSDGQGAVWSDAPVPLRIGHFDMYRSEGKRDTGWYRSGSRPTPWARRARPRSYLTASI